MKCHKKCNGALNEDPHLSLSNFSYRKYQQFSHHMGLCDGNKEIENFTAFIIIIISIFKCILEHFITRTERENLIKIKFNQKFNIIPEIIENFFKLIGTPSIDDFVHHLKLFE